MAQDGVPRSAFLLLGQLGFKKITRVWPKIANLCLSSEQKNSLYANSLYGSYLAHQKKEKEILRQKNQFLPQNLDYAKIPGLSAEARCKLLRWRPATIAHAAQIEGMTPASVVALSVYLKKHVLCNTVSRETVLCKDLTRATK